MSIIRVTTLIKLLVVEVDVPYCGDVEINVAIVSCKEVPTGYKYVDLIEVLKGSFTKDFIYEKPFCSCVGIRYNQRYRTFRVISKSIDVELLKKEALTECFTVAKEYREKLIKKLQGEYNNLEKLNLLNS